jgi:hypothetical protein
MQNDFVYRPDHIELARLGVASLTIRPEFHRHFRFDFGTIAMESWNTP